MQLLDLPTELVRLIVQQSYEPWSIELRTLVIDKDASWRFEAGGFPSLSLSRICRTIRDMAMEAEKNAFTGKMYIEEDTSAMSLTYEAFIESTQSNARHEWVRQNVSALRFSNPTNNPAVWRFVHSLYAPSLPKLERIELDCRYHYHFAVHNIANAEDFLSGKDGKLEKLIDYRQSFFLGCERFLLHSIRQGLAIQVIRNMGIREGVDRCRAVVVGIDYVANNLGQLVLDWRSLQSKTAIINGWPDKIKETLSTLKI